MISFKEIIEKIKSINFEDFDVVIGIADGGIVPASLIAQLLNKDMRIIRINFRDKDNALKYDEPKLLSPISFNYKNKRILLVDDVSKTGKTLNKAKELLKDNKIKTFVLNGKADYSLFNFEECVDWPWK